MTPEEKRAQQEFLAAKRAELFGAYPEVDRFMRQKSRALRFLLLYVLILNIAKALVIGASPVVLVIGVLMGTGIQAIFLAAGMGTKWRIALILYFLALYQLGSLAATLVNAGVTSWEAFCWAYIDGFSQYPAAILIDLFSVLYALLVLGAAIWLTVPAKSRRLAEQSDTLMQQWKAEAGIR